MNRQIRSPACPHRLRALRRLSSTRSVLTSALLLSGCTWFSPDAGMGVVATIAQQELKKDAVAVRRRRRRLLAPPFVAFSAAP
jgi:hypothetical protein